MSSRSLADPRGLIRGLGTPAAVLRNGVIVAKNALLREVLGGPDGEQPIDDVLDPESSRSTLAWLAAARASGGPAGPHTAQLVSSAGRALSADLSYLPVEGTAGSALLLVRLTGPNDIRHGVLAELRGRFGEIINAVEDIVVVHAIDGQFLLANRAVQDFVGQPEEELLKLNIKDFIPESQHAAVRERAATRVAGVSDRMYTYDITVISPDGQERELEISSAPILVNGDPVAVLVIGRFRDAAQLRTRALERERDSAVAANHAKREFLAHMSHEVRTPINIIFGMTEMALDEELPSDARRYVGRVRDAASTLLSLVEDVLEFSRVEARKYAVRPRRFALRERLAATIDGLATVAWGRGLSIETSVASDVPDDVIGDPDRLHQVLVNLLTNALKFTPQGRVGVRVECASADVPGQHHVRFAVFDEGVGLTVEQRARIFDPFQQMHEEEDAAEGTGLGLAIVRELVTLLGGQIWVESEPGEGSTFYFDAVFQDPSSDPSAAR